MAKANVLYVVQAVGQPKATSCAAAVCVRPCLSVVASFSCFILRQPKMGLLGERSSSDRTVEQQAQVE